MGDLPYMPLWIADLMSDRKVICMDAAEFGIYMAFMFSQWIDGPLPDDDDMLCRIGKGCEISQAKAVLKAGFELTHEGWANKRVTAEYAKLMDKRQKLSEAGRRGGKVSKRKGMHDKPGLSQAEAKSKPGRSMLELESDPNKCLSRVREEAEEQLLQLESEAMRVFGSPASGKISLWLEVHDAQWIRKAMAEAEACGKKFPGYVDGILKNWRLEGYPKEKGNGRSGTNRRSSGKNEGVLSEAAAEFRDRKPDFVIGGDE